MSQPKYACECCGKPLEPPRFVLVSRWVEKGDKGDPYEDGYVDLAPMCEDCPRAVGRVDPNPR